MTKTPSSQGLAHSGSSQCQRMSRIAALVGALLAACITTADAQEQPVSAWPNTLRLQSLIPGSEGRDIVKMRSYDHIGSPSCSKDGEFAAFDAFKIVSQEMVTRPECWVVRRDGTGLFRLAQGSTPRWSPDGKRLVFMREGLGGPDKDIGIFVIDRDGKGERRIGPGRWPDWSPDGQSIAYSMGGTGGGGARRAAQVYVARIDGSAARRICEGDCPSWSPDGKKIACCYVGPASTSPEIRVVDVSSERALTVGVGWYRPDWLPDGKTLICNGRVGQNQGMVRLSVNDPDRKPELLIAGSPRETSPCYVAKGDAIVYVQERPRSEKDDAPHTFDGRYEIRTIDLTVVYLVPKDRRPLVDWRERVDYFVKRLVPFHNRESGGRSTLRVHVQPEPLKVTETSEMIRGKSPDETFDNSTRLARSALKWLGKREGFPILLVLSEINWRDMDDFQRLALVDDVPVFDGSIDQEGRHFPGASAGGARANYSPDEGLGMGLVSGDGWRVPYSGSDSVVYHEGVGHPIGLLHPEPIDDSVMGVAQYKFWINQTWVNPAQKRALGLADEPGANPGRQPGRTPTNDLFTVFTALPHPLVPKTNEPVKLDFTWPDGSKLREIKIQVQTALRGPWRAIPVGAIDGIPASLPLGAFDRPTPVSYRVDASLVDGQIVELWGYFWVEAPR